MVTTSGGTTITALTQDQEIITINWEHINWAAAYKTPNRTGARPQTSDDVVARGDVVYVSQTADGQWRLDQLPQISGALVSIDPNTGAIYALTGGFDYYLSKFNRATQALRQPGSNIKPFIYSAALEHGFTAASRVSAMPVVVEDDLEGVWSPQNYGRKFIGPTRLREALSRSLNLVSVRLVRAIGVDATIAHLAKFGFAAENIPRSLSLALGSMTISPLDLAAGFAVFANGGKRIRPYLIERITDGDGNDIALDPAWCNTCAPMPDEVQDESQDELQDYGQDENQDELGDAVQDELPAVANDTGRDELNNALTNENELDGVLINELDGAQDYWHTDNADAPAVDKDRAISEQNAFLINNMMREVIRTGTGRRALALNRADLAGKTGTTNNFRDAWFSGFQRDMVTTVFVGFDEPAHLGRRESGASAALPIWVDYMRAVLKDFPERDAPTPPGVTAQFINKHTSQLTRIDDPDGYFEYFKIGSEPDNRIDTRPPGQSPTDVNDDAGELF